MTERRSASRRTRNLVPEPLTRRKERRGDERRDWPRIEVAFDVREAGQKGRSCLGDLSVDGAAFITTAPPMSDEVVLRFHIPTYDGPIVVHALVVGRVGVPRGTQLSVVFTELNLEAQLAIAQWFDETIPRPTAVAPSA